MAEIRTKHISACSLRDKRQYWSIIFHLTWLSFVSRCWTPPVCVTASLRISFTHTKPAAASRRAADWSDRACWLAVSPRRLECLLRPARCFSLQICSWGGGGGGRAAQVCLLGSSCLLISGEQMEESPHLAGDQFYPRSSGSSGSGGGSNLGLFIS